MPRLAFILLLLLTLDGAATEASPRRIASLNLCIDQLLLRLVSRERVVSVSHWAADPHVSAVADRARGLPRNSGRAEEVIALAPDLVLAGRFNSPPLVAALRGRGLRLVQLTLPQDVTALPAFIREFGSLLGADERAQRMAAELEASLPPVGQTRGPDSPVAAVLGANGMSPAGGTWLDSVLRAAGWRNLAALGGGRGYTGLGLEQVIAAQPSLLLREGGVASGNALAAQEPDHPALRRFFGPDRILDLDPRSTICPDPGVAAVIDQLRALRS